MSGRPGASRCRGVSRDLILPNSWRKHYAAKKQTSFSELRVGFWFFRRFAILILVIFAVSGDIKLPGIGRTITVKTYMSSVDGLRKGAEVRLSGQEDRAASRRSTSAADSERPECAEHIEIVMEIDGNLGGTPGGRAHPHRLAGRPQERRRARRQRHRHHPGHQRRASRSRTATSSRASRRRASATSSTPRRRRSPTSTPSRPTSRR